MPILTINTNIKVTDIPADFAASAVEVVAHALGKPISYVVVDISSDRIMNWGGSGEPCAVATLGSIGQINPEANIKTTKLITDLVAKKLNIPGDRFYLILQDIKASDCGYTGTTFAEIFK
ncbi:Macrophage migration inhibitory factor -like protein [Halotydeus destructor]|nr:Macrophage migration inhibitory factor -like protein [Halotydeus destructor]